MLSLLPAILDIPKMTDKSSSIWRLLLSNRIYNTVLWLMISAGAIFLIMNVVANGKQVERILINKSSKFIDIP